MSADNTQRIVRRALGAGRWFPENEVELRNMIENYMEKAEASPSNGVIVAALAPHAGYLYSGKVAGHTYRAIREQARAGNSPEIVVVIGFSHRSSFEGVALMDGDAILTPLGETELDKEAAAFLIGQSDLIKMNYAPHNGEWSAENQIPFIQAALPGVPLVVAITGDHNETTANALAEALKKLALKRKTLVVGSTDMLHDADYDLVAKTDRASLKLVEGMKTGRIISEWNFRHQTFCGIMAVATTMKYAESQGCEQGTTLYYRNSGDDFPESRGQWVVGYCAVLFRKTDGRDGRVR